MFHLVKTDEKANPVLIRFFRTNTVTINPNDRANLITKARLRLYAVHVGVPLSVAVYMYSIIVCVKSRSQAITWWVG
jgi:hypothetical protein